jgi:hypothetical protein
VVKALPIILPERVRELRVLLMVKTTGAAGARPSENTMPITKEKSILNFINFHPPIYKVAFIMAYNQNSVK